MKNKESRDKGRAQRSCPNCGRVVPLVIKKGALRLGRHTKFGRGSLYCIYGGKRAEDVK